MAECDSPMVNPGGKSTMLGHWRMALRQAEEAARAGRYDEALALASRPDVADHHHAVRLRAKLAQELVARSARRGQADDVSGAVEDLDLAERLGAPPTTLAAAATRHAAPAPARARAGRGGGARRGAPRAPRGAGGRPAARGRRPPAPPQGGGARPAADPPG